jgi:hypothetical protein
MAPQWATPFTAAGRQTGAYSAAVAEPDEDEALAGRAAKPAAAMATMATPMSVSFRIEPLLTASARTLPARTAMSPTVLPCSLY